MAKDKTYDTDEETTGSIVEEAAVAYESTTHATTRVISLMGMDAKKEYKTIANDNDFIHLIRNGLPKKAMDNLMDVTGINAQEMASITHTSDRTLRRYTAATRLNQELSERMVELARLYERGQGVFGSMERFKKWMDTPLTPLGHATPKSYLDTSMGIDLLMTELGRIEHGIFA